MDWTQFGLLLGNMWLIASWLIPSEDGKKQAVWISAGFFVVAIIALASGRW